MNIEEIKKAILELKPEDRARLLKELGPELCESVMGEPDTMAQMMPRCREMMNKHPEMMKRMLGMMSQMGGT